MFSEQSMKPLWFEPSCGEYFFGLNIMREEIRIVVFVE